MSEIAKRRTFAIISHPDAGKTTLTEMLLLYGGAIQLAGTVKARKSVRHATSDWMALEQKRGISMTTAVMQFPYKDCIVNLLDTPGHADFSEDTYRTLTAVDSALMVIDGAKGVEVRTIKLLEVCRLRTTPIVTFINKFDRDCKEPIELLDEIERVLNIHCAPVTWPIGMGKNFKGIYHLINDQLLLFSGKSSTRDKLTNIKIIQGLDNSECDKLLGAYANDLREEMELIQGASHSFDQTAFLKGELTPVYFGTALANFGVREMLDGFIQHAPAPQARETTTRSIKAQENKFTGFVFKIQANMDPKHRDRIAFLRICSGHYQQAMKIKHVRLGKTIKISNALTFMAGEREQLVDAWAGDIIGLHNYGSIQIGDSFTEGEDLQFTGIPNFAPELFRIVRLKDPLQAKALQKGLLQLSEEGATQVFRPLMSNDLVLGAIGILQFDVVAFRLKNEYNVTCAYDNASIATVRWIKCDDKKRLSEFEQKAKMHLARDASDALTYLAPSKVNLQLTQERWPEIEFLETREH